jgi:dolichyldiphosphatase
LTLSPFFLFSAYATLILINRPLSVVNILIGQLANEGINYVLKEHLKADRPTVLGDGYGMPSSHSQVGSLQLDIRKIATDEVMHA